MHTRGGDAVMTRSGERERFMLPLCGSNVYSENLSSLSVGHYELCRDDIGDLPGSPVHL